VLVSRAHGIGLTRAPDAQEPRSPQQCPARLSFGVSPAEPLLSDLIREAMKRLTAALVCLYVVAPLALISPPAGAEPFMLQTMPSGLDGSIHARGVTRRPMAVDFDGDGVPTWYAGGNRLTDFPQSSTTTTLPAISLPACPACAPRYLAFAVADVNRDGLPDIVRINEWAGHSYAFTIQVFLSDAEGGFTLGWRHDWNENPGYSAGQRYFEIVLKDFDRDGDPDLAVLSTYHFTNTSITPHRDEGSLIVRWNSNGQFSSVTTIQSRHFSEVSRLFADDLDGDGDVDLLVNSSTTWSPQGNFTYTFTTRLFYNEGNQVFSVTSDESMSAPLGLIDINRDSFVDFLGWAHGAGSTQDITWRANTRDGGFWGFGTLATGASNLRDALMVDLNEDGIADLVTIEGPIAGESPRLVARFGQPNVTFSDPVVLFTMASNILSVGVGDAGGDGDTDLVLRMSDGSFRMARNLAQRLQPRSALGTPITVSGLTRLLAADVNRDGILDLLALQPGGSRIYLAPGAVAGGFGVPQFKTLVGSASDFTIADFNRDGRPDLAYVLPGAGAVRTLMQNDSIFFGWLDTKIADFAGAHLIRAGHAAVNNGTIDLLVANNVNGGLRWLTNQGGAVSWGATNPALAQDIVPASLFTVPYYAGAGDAAFSCASDDIVLTINGYSNILGWTRTAHLLQVVNASRPVVCTTGNLDADRTDEIIFVDGQNGALLWWNPTNEVNVTGGTIDPTPPGIVQALATIDWNRDGRLDVLAGTTQGLYLYSRETSGNEWTRRLIGSSAVSVRDIAVGDFNRDSLPDVAFIDEIANHVQIRYNASRVVVADSATMAPGGVLSLANGANGVAFSINVRNPGRFLEDASIAVTGSRVVFHKAVSNNGSWSIGATMSKAEVEQAVASVTMRAGGQLIGTTGTGAVNADGSLAIDATILSTLTAIFGDQSLPVEFRVTLKPTANSASYTDFYLAHAAGDIGKARVLHAGQPVGRLGLFAQSVATRVSIQQHTPPGAHVFSSGFEAP
jgi:hypothetical protein